MSYRRVSTGNRAIIVPWWRDYGTIVGQDECNINFPCLTARQANSSQASTGQLILADRALAGLIDSKSLSIIENAGDSSAEALIGHFGEIYRQVRVRFPSRMSGVRTSSPAPTSKTPIYRGFPLYTPR